MLVPSTRRCVGASFALAGLLLGFCAPSVLADTNKFWACKFGEFYNVKTAHCVSCKTCVSEQAPLAKCRSCKGGMTWDIRAKQCVYFGGGVVR